MAYHRPVLLPESIEGLKIKPDGIYVDGTFGGGGHSKSILAGLGDNGHLFAFDQDEDAKSNILEDERFTFIHANFRYLREYMAYYDVKGVDGILVDLGVSSWQFDNPERGFSYRFDHALDMRMNREQENTATEILNAYSAQELQRVLGEYGQVRNARTLAQAIVKIRQVRPIRTVGEFLDFLEPYIRGQRMRYLSQVFQALRIEVNDEVGALAAILEQGTELLVKGGRLVVISYHSIEDQMVKRWLRAGNVNGQVPKDEYGVPHVPMRAVTRKPVEPDVQEIHENQRARSARLRVGEKL